MTDRCYIKNIKLIAVAIKKIEKQSQLICKNKKYIICSFCYVVTILFITKVCYFRTLFI